MCSRGIPLFSLRMLSSEPGPATDAGLTVAKAGAGRRTGPGPVRRRARAEPAGGSSRQGGPNPGPVRR